MITALYVYVVSYDTIIIATLSFTVNRVYMFTVTKLMQTSNEQ